jgi:CheY-like chemotaxis protein
VEAGAAQDRAISVAVREQEPARRPKRLIDVCRTVFLPSADHITNSLKKDRYGGEATIVGILLSLLAKTPFPCPTEFVGSALTIQRTTEASMYQRTVLVVDDEPLIRMTLADCLAEEGYAVLEAANVLEAVAVLSRHPIDALITDVDMPGALNGFDLVRLVASYGAGVAMIVTSGGHSAPEFEGEQVCFLAKPYRMDTILFELEDRMSAIRYPTAALAG